MESIGQRLSDTEARSIRNEKRVESLEKLYDENKQMLKEISSLSRNMAVMASNIKNLNNQFGDMKQRLDEVCAEPGKRYRHIINIVITTLVGGMVTLIAAAVLIVLFGGS